MMANYSGIRIIDDGHMEYYCTRCNKLIYETDSDYAFKKCKLYANREAE